MSRILETTRDRLESKIQILYDSGISMERVRKGDDVTEKGEYTFIHFVCDVVM